MRYILAAIFLLAPLTATAQPAAPPCRMPVPDTKVMAATTAPGAALLLPGRPVSASLQPAAQINFALAPERKPVADSHGGLFAFTITEAGSYRIGLTNRAWLDVVDANGKTAASTTHRHAEACTLFVKQVDFSLRPGRYLVQISSSPDETVAMLVEKVT